MNRLLVVTAVEAEAVAFGRHLPRGSGAARVGPGSSAPEQGGVVRDGPGQGRGGPAVDGIDVRSVGVGPAAAAAGTARLLALAGVAGAPYTAVVSAGIAGGWSDAVAVGGMVLGTACRAADLGAESAEGFLPLDALGFGSATAPVDAGLLAALVAALPDATVGAILTVSTVTGTAEGAAVLRARHPDALAEAMEGYGVGVAAEQAGVPFVELRTISNPVGPRDRSAWRVGAALDALAQAGSVVAGTLKAWH